MMLSQLSYSPGSSIIGQVTRMGNLSYVRRHAASLILVAFISLGAFLRLANLDLAEFKRDEAQLAVLSLDLLSGAALPLKGIGTSVRGLENGPMMVYLVAIPLAIARDFAWASGFVGLLNVAALLVTARVTERLFGRLAALLATATYAVGSYAVIFSRKLWPYEAMPLFSALLMLGLYDAVIGRRNRGLVLAFVSLGALVSLHPSGVLFIPVVGIGLVLRPGSLRARETFLGLGIAGVMSLPYVLSEIVSGFPGVRALRGMARTSGLLRPDAMMKLRDIVGVGGYVENSGVDSAFVERVLRSGPLTDILFAACLVGIGTLVVQAIVAIRRGSGWRGRVLGLTWIAVPLAVETATRPPMHVHYLTPLLPAAFAMIGVGLATAIRLLARNTIGRRVAYTAVALLVGWAAIVQVQHFEAFFQFARERGGATPYGVPLAFHRAAVDRAIALAGDKELTIVSARGPDAADDVPPIWRALWRNPTAPRFFDATGVLAIPAEPGLFVVAPSVTIDVSRALGQRGAPAAVGVALPGLPRGYEFVRTRAPLPRSGASLASFVGGIELDEAIISAVPSLGQEVALSTRWFASSAGAGNLSLFHHLVADDGARIVGADRAAFVTGSFAAGDEMLAWATLATPPDIAPGRYWLDIGLYARHDGARVPIAAGIGAGGSRVRFGPYKIHPAAPASAPASPVARFADGIALESMSLSGGGGIALVWRADAAPRQNWTVFVHVLDASGRIVAQHDGRPLDGHYPTDIWEAGERIADAHPLPPTTLATRLRVGLYDATSGTRAPRIDVPGDSYEALAPAP
ncbi:MAG: hypothetical protein EPO26_03405 [Chloroflexota bacterium]|nr:MAG: hypothetical protein EPO26_03405 [Chloroflexota bacterium]